MKRMPLLLVLVLLLEAAYFLYSGTTDIAVDTLRLRDPALAAATKGLRIVHLSDLHIGSYGFMQRRLLRTIDGIDPDIVLVTGDLITCGRGITPCVQVLGTMAARRTVIVTFGNNDHLCGREWVDTALLEKRLREVGVRVLRNESVRLTAGRGRQAFYCVGLDDNFLGFDDIFRAAENIPPGAPRLLLAHSPEIVEKIRTGDFSLILSGHTHGGQIVVPFRGAVYLNRTCWSRKKLASGLYTGDGRLFISRGIGTVLVPLRLFCRPEMTIIEFSE